MAVGGYELFIDVRGAGSPVVLLHGTPSAPDDFEPLVAALAPHRRVLVPHAPGYGRTPPAPAAVTLPAAAARLEERLLALGVGAADVVAFSGGAYAAAAMALSRRVAVGKLALLAPVV
ncbi:MAG TPA: alpha/beta fold hydrolase, partial [Polyangia bacterium]|nr:alpha/beta fold hydrolase [Polyangia bacterium]